MPAATFRDRALSPFRRLAVWCGLLVGIVACLGGAPQATAGPVAGFSLEVGDAFGFPNQPFISVPVYMTNPTAVTSWEMGLDYDEFMLQLVAVVFTGTESENLSPTVTTPQNPPIHWFRVQYSASDPLPAGPRRVVAYLIFNVSGVPAVTTAYPIEIESDTLINGGQIQTSIDGSLTLIVGDLLRVGETQGSLLGVPPAGGGSLQWPGAGAAPFQPLRLPIRIWNQNEVNTLMVGLVVSESLWLGIDFEGTAVSAATGGDMDVVLADTVAGKLLSLDLNGHPLQPGSAQTIAWLLVAPLEPQAGRYDIVPNPVITLFDSAMVPNLLAGSVEFVPEFVRGDASFDGQVNIADAARILEFLFQSAALPCLEAGDCNADGAVDVADPVFVLNYLFGSGPQPPAPFPAPAIDDDGLPCLGF